MEACVLAFMYVPMRLYEDVFGVKVEGTLESCALKHGGDQWIIDE